MAKAARKAPAKKTRPKPVKSYSKKSPKPAKAKSAPKKAAQKKTPVMKKAAAKKAPKKSAAMKKARPASARKKPAAKAVRKKTVRPVMKARAAVKQPAAQKRAFKQPKKPAKTKVQAPEKEKPAVPQNQLLVIEEKKAPMVVAPAIPLANVPPAPKAAAIAPPVQPVAKPVPPMQPVPPSPPPHIDASRHDDGPLAVPLNPALDMLPEWEDRLRLRRAIFEEGLAFFSLARGCPEYHEAMIALSKSGKDAHEDAQGYFIVCMKDRSGKMVGAMDGHMLENGVMALGRSSVKAEKRREMHILLYSAALFGHQPSYILFSTKKIPLSVDFASRLILLGRGFGFSALPLQKPDMLYFIRRVKRELDPIATGQELAKALSSAKALIGLEKEAAGLEAKGVVPLIPLPTSPDSREHLHELRDVVLGLGISAPDLEGILESLREEYVHQRKDMTPELLF